MKEKRRTLFLLDYCLTPYEKIESCGILCEKSSIIAIGGETAFSLDEPGLEVIDLKGCYGIPGFIDSHVHGIPVDRLKQGIPDIEEQVAILNLMSSSMAKNGITTFLPTLISLPPDKMPDAVDKTYESIERWNAGDGIGAQPVAMHLEGPFLNPEKRGDQPRENIMPRIDLGYARELLQAGRDRIRIMTFAPELPNAIKLVELMQEYGVMPSMGHSLASEKETIAAIEAGAHRCTYIFNAMPSLHHRSSSLTAIALTDERVSIEMIVDGLHLHPTIVNLIARCKSPDKIMAISNAVFNRDMKEDVHGIIRNEAGVISGSTLSLKDAWYHLRSYVGMDGSTASACTSANPAKDLGLLSRGEILPGKRADITIFNSAAETVRMTVRQGNIIYDSESSLNA